MGTSTGEMARLLDRAPPAVTSISRELAHPVTEAAQPSIPRKEICDADCLRNSAIFGVACFLGTGVTTTVLALHGFFNGGVAMLSTIRGAALGPAIATASSAVTKCKSRSDTADELREVVSSPSSGYGSAS